MHPARISAARVRRALRFGPALLAAAWLSPLALADNASPALAADGTDGTVEQLDKFIVTDAKSLTTTLPVRPVSALYGFDTPVQDIPRSVTQVNPQQFQNDVILSVSDLARYSPSVNQATGQLDNYGTPVLRGSQGDLYQNGVRLITRPQNNRPFTLNTYEGADIVAGPAPVVFAPSARTAGYVNYLTKKPNFERTQGTLNVVFGRWYGDGEGYDPQERVQLDVGGPIVRGQLAYRLSYEGEDKNSFYSGVKDRYHDLYGSLGWLPNSTTAVDFNFELGHFDWIVNNFQNRVTNDLIRNGTYLAGPATPIVQVGSSYYSPVLDSSGNATSWIRRTRVVNANGTTAFTAGAATANPTSNSTAGAGTIVGYVLDPTLVHPTSIKASTSLNAPGYPSITETFNSQFRVKKQISNAVALVNNATYQYYKTDTSSNGGFYNWIESRTFENRSEALVKLDYTLFGLPIEHDSSTGFSYRWEPNRNYKDSQRAGYGPTGDQFDLTGNPSGFTRNAFFGATVYPFTGSVNDPVLTRYGYLKGFWQYLTVSESPTNAVTPGGSAAGTLAGNLSTATYDTTAQTLGFYTQHSFKLGQKFIWDVGFRDSLEWADISNAIASPIVAGNDTIGGSVRLWSPTYSTSLSFKPVPRLTTYFTYDRVRATNGNTSGAVAWSTLGFGSTALPNQLDPNSYRSLSSLYEAGLKTELIPNQLFGTAAVYRQTRDLTLSLPSGFSEPVQAKGLYEGIELSLRYQPTRAFALGLNYSYLNATNLNSTYSVAAPIVADNSTNILGATTASLRNYRIVNLPRSTFTLFTSYTFKSGFGVNAAFSANDAYNVSNDGSVTVPGGYSVDLGLFYDQPRYRLSVDVQNLTDTNRHAGGSTPLEPISARARITYKF